MLIENQAPVPKVHAPDDFETDMTVLAGRTSNERVQIMLNKDAFLFIIIITSDIAKSKL